jgi:hypothetical protein
MPSQSGSSFEPEPSATARGQPARCGVEHQHAPGDGRGKDLISGDSY